LNVGTIDLFLALQIQSLSPGIKGHIPVVEEFKLIQTL
jgi:hypothetical protein